MHTTIRRPGRRISALTATAVATALAASAFAGPALAADAAEPANPVGKEASDGSWLGPHLTPTADGDQLGWAIDPGLAEPKADDNTSNYGDPEAWEDLTDEQRLQLVAALYFGEQAIEADEAGEENVDDEFAEELLGTTDADDIAAGVAGIINSVAADNAREGSTWDPEVLDEDSFDVYSALLSGPETASDIDTSDIEFLLRSPGEEAEDHQRVLVIADQNMPWSADEADSEEEDKSSEESEAPEEDATDDEAEESESDTPSNAGEATEEDETDEAPVADVADDAQRKAPVEHRKGPTGEQDRATIVSVPSGPTGGNPLA